MIFFDKAEKTWTRVTDPKDDIIPMGSYLGDAILKKLANCDLSRVAEHNHDTSESITLKDIYERTLTVAANLNDLNLKEDDIIAFYSRNNSYISGIAFGCNLNGTAWCPFDIIQDNLDYLLGYIRPTILIYDEEFKKEVKDSLNRLEMCVKELIFGNPTLESSVENVLLKPQNIKSFVPKDLSKLKSADHLISCISFTSGSTGVPKAVPITHSMFINQINAVAYLDEFNSKNIMSPSGIRWIAQLFIMFLPIFLNTKKTFSGKNPDPVNMCDAIHKWKVSAILTANSMLKAIFNHYESTPGYDFSSLEYLLSGGEPPCASMKSRFIEILPTIKISQGYGITECGGAIAFHNGNINGGPLNRGFSCKIVDENGNNVGHNTPGIVYMKGRGPFPGYFKREDATKASYSDGWFITNDYGIVNEENLLHVYCRFKDIPKCNGKLIIPNIVEENLNKFKFVDLALVIGVPGDSPDNQKIAVYVKLVKGFDDKQAKVELLESLKKVIDLDIIAKFTFVEKFKVNSTGKADKEILKREYVL